MKRIESIKNGQVKQWKKLQTKKERDESGLFIIEGFHLVEEALKSNIEIREIIIDEKKVPSNWDMKISCTLSTEEVLKYVSDTEAPQGIIAICKQFSSKAPSIQGKNILLIDAVQDPGNIGTMIRTADAVGMDMVVLGEGCVDIYNPKLIRSTQGSLFHLPIIKGNLLVWIEDLKKAGTTIYGTALENGHNYKEIATNPSFSLIVGNEGSGVNKQLLARTDKNLYIPIYGSSESLNVAVATGILLYHLK